MNIGQVKWDGRFTYSINKNEVKQLLEPQRNPITGTDFNLKRKSKMGKRYRLVYSIEGKVAL